MIVSEFETIEIIDTKKENNLPIHITKKLPEHPDVPMMACVDTESVPPVQPTTLAPTCWTKRCAKCWVLT